MTLKLRLITMIFVALLTLPVLPFSMSSSPWDTSIRVPDTSSPQATLRSFMESVDRSHQIYTAAVDQYLKEPGLLSSALVHDQ